MGRYLIVYQTLTFHRGFDLTVCNDLRCFPLCEELDDASKDCSFDMLGKPIIWLATMLCRSTTDLNAA